jgi:hypothetical protein
LDLFELTQADNTDDSAEERDGVWLDGDVDDNNAEKTFDVDNLDDGDL